mmetsp:Transcript_35823/g.63286  ORF Transcript_35823/g.63286 Transcript_35823/m.63286 type:complete len:192 (+) Transcript_35823:63-638(+)
MRKIVFVLACLACAGYGQAQQPLLKSKTELDSMKALATFLTAFNQPAPHLEPRRAARSATSSLMNSRPSALGLAGAALLAGANPAFADLVENPYIKGYIGDEAAQEPNVIGEVAGAVGAFAGNAGILAATAVVVGGGFLVIGDVFKKAPKTSIVDEKDRVIVETDRGEIKPKAKKGAAAEEDKPNPFDFFR